MSTAALPAFARLIIKQSWNETRLSVQQDSDVYELAGLRFGMFSHDLNNFVFMSLFSYTCSFKILSFSECIQLALPPDHPWQVVCIPLACLTSSSWTPVRCRRVNTTRAKPTAWRPGHLSIPTGKAMIAMWCEFLSVHFLSSFQSVSFALCTCNHMSTAALPALARLINLFNIRTVNATFGNCHSSLYVASKNAALV